MIDLSLDAPSAFLFTGELCSQSYRLNKFAFDFKQPAVRERFMRDPEGLMKDYALSERERALLRARDWTGLVAAGGNHFNVIKIAAAVGQSHLHVGAHMCGADWDEFKQTLPHRIELMPQEIGAPQPRRAPARSAKPSKTAKRRRASVKRPPAATRIHRKRGKKTKGEE
jgi:protocatechuate 4,5-dioxygenase alpha subunit